MSRTVQIVQIVQIVVGSAFAGVVAAFFVNGVVRSSSSPKLPAPSPVLWDAPSYGPGPYGEGQRAEGLAFAQRWPERQFPEPGVVVARLLKIAPAAVLAPTAAAQTTEEPPPAAPAAPPKPVMAAAPLDGVCARYHLRRVWTDRWRWRCRRG